MKILNLYAGIGGNRKLWGEEHEVTAVENVPEIAAIYKELFPNDEVIITDAHQYLLEHYKEFDFIWSSPPCPSHSKMCFMSNGAEKKYPNMSLYQEIIFLKYWFRGEWIVENVISYYMPLIMPQKIQGHYIWTNLNVSSNNVKSKRIKVKNKAGQTLNVKMKAKDMIIKDFHGYKGDKRTLLNNAIEGELGLHILNSSQIQPLMTKESKDE